MIITKLDIKKLHGKYDYEVNFNKDITILYGLNGCGKTTVLNILSSIITGKIYKLYNYIFDEVILYYQTFNNENKITKRKIRIKSDEDTLVITYKRKKYILSKLQIDDEEVYYKKRKSLDIKYFSSFQVLEKIKSEFNLVYLSLNRSIELSKDEYDNNFFFNVDEIREPEKVDPEIRLTEKLIQSKYYECLREDNKNKDEYRNKILKKSINYRVYKNSKQLLSSFKTYDLEKTKELYKKYLKYINEIEIFKEVDKDSIKSYFDDCIKNIEKHNNKEIDEDITLLVFEYYELNRIESIIEVIQEMESIKEVIFSPIHKFINIINEFFLESSKNKKINISEDGIAYFTDDNSDEKFGIGYLSSGEKQIILFFANLFLRIEKNTTSIFVVDEPELSLHLMWQKEFINRILSVDIENQYIFATHSPEIVGKYKDKMIYLERKNYGK